MLNDGYLHFSTCREGTEQLTELDPAYSSASEKAAGIPAAQTALTPAPNPQTRIPSVLIVDDNPSDVELLRIAFEMSEIAVHLESAADGLSAVQRLVMAATLGTLPDLVLLDLNMPRANGLEVLGSLRRDRRLNRIPVVVLSTSSQWEDRRRCLELGARDFHTKPEHIRDLVQLVQSFQHYLDSAEGSDR